MRHQAFYANQCHPYQYVELLHLLYHSGVFKCVLIALVVMLIRHFFSCFILFLIFALFLIQVIFSKMKHASFTGDTIETCLNAFIAALSKSAIILFGLKNFPISSLSCIKAFKIFYVISCTSSMHQCKST